MSEGPDHTEARRAIRSHFARGNSREVEHFMFTHIRDCNDCRAIYEQYAAVAAMDPEAPSRSHRLLRGLGLNERHHFFSGWRPVVATAGAVATVALLLVVAPWEAEDTGMRARGGLADGPEVTVYRLVDGGSEPVVESVATSDRLAFAYVNPTEAPYLMIFGRAADGEVYWYYPAWRSADENPQAVEVARTTAPEELAEAVRHALPPGRLELVAVFADRRWRVRELEAEIAGGGAENLAELPGAHVWSRSIVVEE